MSYTTRDTYWEDNFILAQTSDYVEDQYLQQIFPMCPLLSIYMKPFLKNVAGWSVCCFLKLAIVYLLPWGPLSPYCHHMLLFLPLSSRDVSQIWNRKPLLGEKIFMENVAF